MPDQPVVETVEEDSPDQNVTVIVDTPTPVVEPETPPAEVVVVPVASEVVDDRVRFLEGRMTVLEAAMTQLQTDHAGYAALDHDHPMPASIQALSDHLSAIESEETMPAQRRGILHRKLIG